MKIAAVSDLHGILPKIEESELLFICGDIVPLGLDFNIDASIQWVKETFIPWVLDLPVRKVILIAGNHDIFLNKHPEIFKGVDKIVYLLNGIYKEDGLIIAGTPYVTYLRRWAFTGTDKELNNIYKSLLYKINKEKNQTNEDQIVILLTHDTPIAYCLDGLNIHINSPLISFIKTLNPDFVFTGHWHDVKNRYYMLKDVGTEIYNVSILNDFYGETYKPTYVEIY